MQTGSSDRLAVDDGKLAFLRGDTTLYMETQGGVFDARSKTFDIDLEIRIAVEPVCVE